MEKCDMKVLYPMLVKSYNHLHLVEDVAYGSINQDVDQDCGLDIFQTIGNNIKTTKEIVTRELLDFKRFHVDVKDIKNPFQQCKKHESRFHVVGFLAKKILGIVGYQIEIECIFSLARILTSLRRYQLQSKNLNKFIFVIQYWPNDFRVGCNVPSTLVEFIEKEELEEFEGEFEREEIVDMNSSY